MTVHLSNLQLNTLQIFMAQKGSLTMEEFCSLDQRITSGLGRRKTPYLARVQGDRFVVTQEGRDAIRMFESTDVFRKVASTRIAHVFDRTRRLHVAPRPGRKSAAA